MKIDYKKLLGQIKNTKVLLIIFIVGIVLIMFPSSEKNSTEGHMEEKQDFSMYQKELEKDLTYILSRIKGAGKVDVMITLEDGGNTFFAQDESRSYDENGDETSETVDATHVLKSEKNNGEAPLITKKTYPKISGVLICAKGAANPQIKNSIITAAQALLGVKSHRIEVLERK